MQLIKLPCDIWCSYKNCTKNDILDGVEFLHQNTKVGVYIGHWRWLLASQSQSVKWSQHLYTGHLSFILILIHLQSTN